MPYHDSQTGRADVAREEAAFTELVERYQRDVLRVCYVILGDRVQAEDAAQAAWLNAWRKLSQLRDGTKVRSWLLAIAANEARQIARRPQSTRLALDPEASAGNLDPGLSDLATALGRLSADDRRILSLKYLAGFNSDEIGHAIRISPGAVRHRLARLLARLREELGP